MSIGRLIAGDTKHLLFLANQNSRQIRVHLNQKYKSFDISKPYFRAGAKVNSAESLVWIYTFIWLYFKHNILL